MGCHGRIVGRSFLAFRKIILHCGTVGSDNRGTVSVIVFNFSRIDYNIEVGDRVAQIIFDKHYCPEFVEVATANKKTLLRMSPLTEKRVVLDQQESKYVHSL